MTNTCDQYFIFIHLSFKQLNLLGSEDLTGYPALFLGNSSDNNKSCLTEHNPFLVVVALEKERRNSLLIK